MADRGRVPCAPRCSRARWPDGSVQNREAWRAVFKVGAYTGDGDPACIYGERWPAMHPLPGGSRGLTMPRSGGR